MSYRLFIKNIILAVSLLPAFGAVAQTKVGHVILITIDGMHSNMITDPYIPAENLKQMRDNGLYVNRIKGVAPAATYPSHTTIITGERPDNHQIFYNAPFTGNCPRTISYWYADSIKAETLWQVVHEKGGKVASLFWPVSTGSRHIDYNVPEFWSIDRSIDQMEYLKAYCTPVGLLDTLELYATGKLGNDNFLAGSIDRDAREAYMTNYIMNTYKPRLLTLHLITTDYAQHQTGMNSARTRRTVGSVDTAVGLIINNLKATGMMDSTVVIVTGDHGFVDVNQELAPNVWLVENGLLGAEYGSAWKACFHNAGAMSFLYLKNRKDTKTLKKVESILASLPDTTRRMFRVLNRSELAALGCDPLVQLAIEPEAGIAVSNRRKVPAVAARKGGTHGYSNGIDHTVLIAYGAGIRTEQKQCMNQTDIKAFVLRLLGIDK